LVSDERFVPVDGAEVYVRQIGAGHPIVVLHGGPDFDHSYLVPELDELAESSRLVYYDQRGRGRSAAGVRPEDVTIDTEIDDLDQLRRQLQLGRIAVLGHSWGGVLAVEYATRHPEHVSHLILMNTAPASGRDADRVRQQRRAGRPAGDVERMQAIDATARFRRATCTRKRITTAFISATVFSSRRSSRSCCASCERPSRRRPCSWHAPSKSASTNRPGCPTDTT